MPAYLVLEVNVTDPEVMAVYRQGTRPLLAKHGAKPLAPAGMARVLEGAGPQSPVGILEFPSKEALDAFWFSPEYQELIKLRAGAASLNVWALDGVG